MDLIILPGNSPLHKTWSPEVKNALIDLFNNIHIIEYTHWDTNKPVIDFEVESEKLEELIKNNIQDNKYVIFAKSAGVMLTLQEIFYKKINPQKCVFLGTPLHWASKTKLEYKSWLTDLSIPSLFIQQKDDPYCPYHKLALALEDHRVKNYDIKEVKGNNHDYRDFSLIKHLVREFLYTT